MLLPSALSCDSSHPPAARLQSRALFTSPPSSPPTSAQSALGNLVNSCRALQSMLSTPATNALNDNTEQRDQLPTPPMSYAPLPPRKLRLRDRRRDADAEMIPRKKVVKRSTAPPRGVNKRRRAVDDDMGRDDDIDSDLEIGSSSKEPERETPEATCRPSTPKRARIAPEVMPLGLERSDFHRLHTSSPAEKEVEGSEVEVEADGENWSLEDDRILVELVLEKLKLSKEEWQDCARTLGKDRNSLGRRWKSLVNGGNVGLKSRGRRSKIHSTWR
ncbi:hypothetical protein F4809DRAFT_616170 [Biscogniauxia mediterranea]|nr:hypothetical protein F4809DRAFT_616170 [Biscogniauxia mediterranea]